MWAGYYVCACRWWWGAPRQLLWKTAGLPTLRVPCPVLPRVCLHPLSSHCKEGTGPDRINMARVLDPRALPQVLFSHNISLDLQSWF